MKLQSSFDLSSSGSSTSTSPVSIMGGSQQNPERPLLVWGPVQTGPDPKIYGHMTPVEVDTAGMQMNISLTLALHRVWHGEFDRLFCQYFPDSWTLRPTEHPPQERGWSLFQDSAKVRFNCTSCGRCWTSMKGRVAFWYLLLQTEWRREGCVIFKLYGQSCKRCQQDPQAAMWYPEEVLKVVGNVYNRIGQAYYNFRCPPLCVSRRQGRPREQHDSRLCQACHDGLCRKEWTFREFPATSSASSGATKVPVDVVTQVSPPVTPFPSPAAGNVPPNVTSFTTPTSPVGSIVTYPPLAGPPITQGGFTVPSFPPPGVTQVGPIMTSYPTTASSGTALHTSSPPPTVRRTPGRMPSQNPTECTSLDSFSKLHISDDIE